MWVNGKWVAVRKGIKKHGGDKAFICHSIFTASIFILSCIMRFAQNASVCSQTEMSALGLSGWPCGSQMHANMTQTATSRCRERETLSISLSLSLFSALHRHLYSVKSHRCCIYSLAESLFWRLVGRGELVISQACRVGSDNRDSGPSEQQQPIYWAPPPPAAPTHPLPY